jgi:hypothetical protein
LESRFNQERTPAQTPLTEDELTRLLERLGEGEFCESGTTTIGAVAEATGASVADLAAMLQDLRKEDRATEQVMRSWDAPYEVEVDAPPRRRTFGKRAAAVEEEYLPAPPEQAVDAAEQRQELERIRDSRAWMIRTTLVFFPLLLVFILVVFAVIWVNSPTPTPLPR